MTTREEALQKAVELLKSGYEQLYMDMDSGMPPETLAEKHNAIYEQIEQELEELLEVPTPEIIVQVVEGEVVGVVSLIGDLTYVVQDNNYEFDPYAIEECSEPIAKDYEDIIKEISE